MGEKKIASDRGAAGRDAWCDGKFRGQQYGTVNKNVQKGWIYFLCYETVYIVIIEQREQDNWFLTN